MKRLAILGSTGSIGANTLAVVDRHPDRFEVVAYGLFKANDPVYALLKSAFENKMRFSVYLDQNVADEIIKQARCQACTARGEIQGPVKIHSVTIGATR